MVQKRKLLVKRAFNGLVGLPPDTTEEPGAQPEQQKIPRRFTGLAGSPLAKIIEFPGYDPERFREEIDKATGYAAVRLIEINGPDQGRILLRELRSIIDYELWWAITTRYRDRMNAALAYTIARNQAKKFLGQLAEQGQDKSLSFDENPPIIEGKEQPYSLAELIHAALQREGIRRWEFKGGSVELKRGLTWEDVLIQRGGMKALAELVATWSGTKYVVGRWLLTHPDLTVRDIPLVPKSTAARYRKEVLDEFAQFVRGKHPTQNQEHKPGDGTNPTRQDI